jgi:predicted dehydrogenase
VQAGKDVVCEKTLANSASEAYTIVKAVQENRVLFFTAYMKRFSPWSKELEN